MQVRRTERSVHLLPSYEFHVFFRDDAKRATRRNPKIRSGSRRRTLVCRMQNSSLRNQVSRNCCFALGKGVASGRHEGPALPACTRSLLELRGRPRLVAGFHQLYAALNKRSKELHLARKEREASSAQPDAAGPPGGEAKESPHVDSLRESEASAEESQVLTPAVKGTTRRERFRMRKLQRRKRQPSYRLPQYLKGTDLPEDEDDVDSVLGPWDGVFNNCTEDDVTFLRKVYFSTVRNTSVFTKLGEAYSHWGKEQHTLLYQMGLEEHR